MTTSANAPIRSWLTRYYAVRALFSAGWAILAFAVGRSGPMLGIALIIAYPAWDALANLVDARRSGGFRANPTQLVNAVVSAVVTSALAVAATIDFSAMIAVVGIWASLAGILQLVTAVRRWRSAGAQWPMIVSGGQSALAGAIFLQRAAGSTPLSVADVAPYAAFGAAYFAISAGVLVFNGRARSN